MNRDVRGWKNSIESFDERSKVRCRLNFTTDCGYLVGVRRYDSIGLEQIVDGPGGLYRAHAEFSTHIDHGQKPIRGLEKVRIELFDDRLHVTELPGVRR